MGKYREERKDPFVAEALKRFLASSGYSQATVARIIDAHPSGIQKTIAGYRPYSKVLARLHLVTKDEAFAPKDDNERKALEFERANPPAPLKEYLEKGIVPPSPPMMWDVKRQQREEAAQGHEPRAVSPSERPVRSEPKRASAAPKAPIGTAEAKPDDRSKAILDHALQILCALMGTDLDSLHGVVRAQLGQIQGQEPNAPPGVVGSPWFDQIMKGSAEIVGQEHQDIRFVLTADRFQPLEGRFTKAELEDTVRLIQELRRRLNISVQLTDTEERSKIAHALAREVDELYLSIELTKEVVPTGAATRISQMRATFAKITGKPAEAHDNNSRDQGGKP